MIKNIKFFLSNNKDAFKLGKLVKDKLELAGFNITNDKYDLALAIGNDDIFNNMLKNHNYNEYMNYGLIKIDKNLNADRIASEIKNAKYNANTINLMKIQIDMEEYLLNYLVNSKFAISNPNLENMKMDMYVNNTFSKRIDQNSIIFYNIANELIYQTNIFMQMIDKSLNKTFFSSDEVLKIFLKSQEIILNIDDQIKYYNNIPEIEIEGISKRIKCLKI